MTSNDEKTVHQQCIDEVMARAESPSGAINEGDARKLAAEVRRLREQLNHFIGGTQYLAMSAEIDRLSEESKLFREAGHSAELRIAELREQHLDREWGERYQRICAKLARVEAWYARTTTSEPDELCEAMDELGNKILRG
jgi:hypothetical protein